MVLSIHTLNLTKMQTIQSVCGVCGRFRLAANEKAYCEVGAIELPQLHSELINS